VIFGWITAARQESGPDQFHRCSVTPGGNNKEAKHTGEAQRKSEKLLIYEELFQIGRSCLQENDLNKNG
jgi:hypothetical protein